MLTSRMAGTAKWENSQHNLRFSENLSHKNIIALNVTVTIRTSQKELLPYHHNEKRHMHEASYNLLGSKTSRLVPCLLYVLHSHEIRSRTRTVFKPTWKRTRSGRLRARYRIYRKNGEKDHFSSKRHDSVHRLTLKWQDEEICKRKLFEY